MKKLLLLTATIAISFLTFAQVSQGTMTAKIKGDDSSVISVEYSGNGHAEKEYDNGAWHNYFYQNYKTKSKTDYPGITFVYSGVIRYENNQFDQYLIGDSWYEGVPDPDKEELLSILKGDLINFLKLNNYNDIVGEISEITFADNNAFHWKKLDHLLFKVNVTYTSKETYTTLEKATHTYEISLMSDGYKGPWKSNFISSYQKDDKVLLETLTYTADEIDAMKTLAIIDEENKANAFLATLPEVEDAPVFESDKQLFYYIHEKIMTESTEDVKAHLYKVMDESCYQENSSVLLKNWADEWYQDVTTKHDAYKGAHCMYPTVKAHQNGMITFYDRENKRMLRISGTQSGDTWKLTEVDFYPAKTDEIARMKNNDANCGEKPELTVRKVLSYSVGDRVLGKFTQGWYAGTIDKLDPYNKNRYHVLYDDGDQKWMDEIHLKPGSAAATTEESTDEVKEETPTTQVTFKVGDKVLVNTTSGKKKGEIIKYASNKYLVKFKDPRLGDTWCKPGNLEHQ